MSYGRSIQKDQANVDKGRVPETCRGLACYLAKYVACPPIAARRIVSYDGQRVKYWYKDHKEKSKKCEEVDVFTFIGRMVQHIMPKWFQRVRYFGLEATKTFEKWAGAVREGVEKIGRVVKVAYQIVRSKKYRERYKEIGGQDPMICRYCGCGNHGRYGTPNMDLFTMSMQVLTMEDMKKHQNQKEGVDVPFGPPPEEYNYRCPQCQHEMKVNEAIIDVEIAKAEFEGTYHEGFMPILGCPNCNRETMEYAWD